MSGTRSDWRGSRAIEALGPGFYEPVEPARFPEHRSRVRNDRAAALVGLDGLSDGEWINHFARFEPLPDSLPRPLALAYHGHQFRVYNPDIGDGRGFLFAQGLAGDGRLLDLGTKGSGRTPFSRTGDGRLTLKGGVREVLATEMLAALGVDTSHTLSLVETGEALMRGDEPSPTRSAVLVRLSHGHVRIGSFQRLATLGDADGLSALTGYVLRELYREEPGAAPAVRLLELVIARTADLAAAYMVAGFVHGVLNSDNINVTGESFDYGPWRFAPSWDPDFTAAYFDHAGLYAFARQPEAILWDVAQLARSLVPVAPLEELAGRLDRFAELYHAAFAERVCWRLGVRSHRSREVAGAVERALVESRVPLDRFWFDWRGGAVRPGTEGRYAHPAFDLLRQALADADAVGATHPYWSDAEPCSLQVAEVEAIWRAIDERDDWSVLEGKVSAIRRMGEALGVRAAGPRSGTD